MKTPRSAEVIPLGADDAALVVRFKSGDRAAFSTLVGRHQAAVLAYCASVLGDVERARDAGQEAFLTLWRTREQYEHRGQLRAYLIGIARHRCLATLKKGRSAARLQGALAEAATAVTDGGVARHEAREAVAKGLAGLDADRAEVVRLRYLHELSIEEIGRTVGAPTGTIKSRLSRGLRMLKEALSDV